KILQGSSPQLEKQLLGKEASPTCRAACWSCRDSSSAIFVINTQAEVGFSVMQLPILILNFQGPTWARDVLLRFLFQKLKPSR
ncbi:mCG144877, partial [Mus musculus]